MGYLVCDKCGARYELEEGESADNFKCRCGGKLQQVNSVYGGTKKENPYIKKFISNKIALIGSIIFIILFLFFIDTQFSPISEKLDNSLPNTAGAYYVPQSMREASSITGMPYDSRFDQPTKYDDSDTIKSFEKTYIRNSGSFEIDVSMSFLEGNSPDEVDSISKGAFYSTETMMIAGKSVDYSGSSAFSWHGNQYDVFVVVNAPNSISYSERRSEGINFLNSFIPEFDKINKYN